ncbi:hypothetical protein V2K57_25425 [Pseudomonas alliivorans]|nr:hypothetical protein [Pseudomonas alliivorans]MEE4703757.1 hypothetical protein [Pseudomonas alliivorans]MEE4739731.1 hypothetical protein [Pseudomonas alliivorans]
MKSVLRLPVALQILIDQVNAEQIDYRGRDDDAEQLENYLAAGNHSMAEFVAGQMINHQQQYRHAQAHGLPAPLQALIDQVDAEQIDYRGRDDDAEQLENYLAAGNHSMAEFVAGQMINQQQQYRHAQAHGLPAPLQALIDQVNAEQIDYRGRDDDADQLENYLAAGNHSMAEFVASQMIIHQQQYRHAQARGLPAQLQALIDQVDAEQIDYLGRDDDFEQLENYLAAGNHSMAEFVVGQMINHQQQYRHAQAHGLPAPLQALIDQVDAEQIDYRGRDDDAEQLENYLAAGNHSMAEFVAGQMVEQQLNLRSRNS